MESTASRIDFDPTEIVAEHRSRIYRYLLRMTRDPDAAEDLTQETFLRVLRSLGSLRDREALVAWLYRLATNVFIDRVRAGGSGRLAYPAKRDSGGIDPIEEIPDPAARVGRRVEQAQMSECVQGFVDDLPDDYRAAILLHDAQGLSSRDIAEVLGVSVATAKIRIHRGRVRLRTALGEGCEFENDDRGVTVCDPVSSPPPE